MVASTPGSYEELTAALAGAGEMVFVLPEYTLGRFEGCAARTDRLERLFQSRGPWAQLLLSFYTPYHSMRQWWVALGNRELTGAVYAYQVAWQYISHYSVEKLPSDHVRVTFVGKP